MRLTRWIWLPLALTLAGGARFTFAQEKPNEETATTTTPADWRTRIAPTDFASSGTGSWLSPTIVAPFPFDELIYSWNAALPPREGFRLYLKVTFGPADESPWLPERLLVESQARDSVADSGRSFRHRSRHGCFAALPARRYHGTSLVAARAASLRRSAMR